MSLLNSDTLAVESNVEGLLVQSNRIASAEAYLKASDAVFCLLLPGLEETCR